MGREVLGWIGSLTETRWGMDLLNETGYWKWVNKLIEMKNRDHVIMVILYSLHYEKELKAREFL